MRVAREMALHGLAASLTDAAVGCAIAFAGVRGGIWNVLINLKGIKDAAYVAEMRAKCAAVLEKSQSCSTRTSITWTDVCNARAIAKPQAAFRDESISPQPAVLRHLPDHPQKRLHRRTAVMSPPARCRRGSPWPTRGGCRGDTGGCRRAAGRGSWRPCRSCRAATAARTCRIS